MRLKNILNDSEIQDIPILYVLRVITAVQKEIIDEESSNICKRLSESYERIKEWVRCFRTRTQVWYHGLSTAFIVKFKNKLVHKNSHKIL